MRVLDLNTLYIDGGAGGVNTYLREKSRWMAAVAHEGGERLRHVIVVPGKEDRKTTLGASTLYTLKSPRVPGNGQHRVLVSFARIGKILRAEAPDVVEVDTSYYLGRVAARALWARRVPIVGFHHVHLPAIYARWARSWLGDRITHSTVPFVWRYLRSCAGACDVVAVPTRGLRSALAERGLPNLAVVPLGVNLELFRPRVNGSRPALLGLDPRRPVVLYVGRLSREKDLQVLYGAHEALSRDCGSQLLIAGDGPLRRQTQRMARSRTGVVYAGPRDYGEALAQLYRSADVLAVPGRSETFSLIVLEAYASGIPVVAVRQGGPAEICRQALGDLARPGDPADFADKVRSVLARRIPAADCRGHVEATYSWERTFRRLLDLYRSVSGRAAVASPRPAEFREPLKVHDT